MLQLDGLTVADALKMHYDDTKGVKKRYKQSDLLYNLQHSWLVYKLHAGDLRGREAAANTVSSWPAMVHVAQAADGAGNARHGLPRLRLGQAGWCPWGVLEVPSDLVGTTYT